MRLPDLRIEYETREGERTRGVPFTAKNSRPPKTPQGVLQGRDGTKSLGAPATGWLGPCVGFQIQVFFNRVYLDVYWNSLDCRERWVSRLAHG